MTCKCKKEIKDYGHTFINILNIKKQSSSKTLSMFYVEIKPKNNNKDIYEIKLLFQCKIKFGSPHPKRKIPQCITCQ